MAEIAKISGPEKRALCKGRNYKYLHRNLLEYSLDINLCMLRVRPHDTRQEEHQGNNDYWGAISRTVPRAHAEPKIEFPPVRQERKRET